MRGGGHRARTVAGGEAAQESLPGPAPSGVALWARKRTP